MKPEIHPVYNDIKVTCSCGESFETRSTVGKDLSIRELPGGRCISLLFQGPYGEAAHQAAYEDVFAHIKQKGYRALVPSREIFHKGPGMIFRGNPKKYLTEIQVLVEQGEP